MSDLGQQLLAAIVGAMVPILVAVVNDWLKRQKPKPAPELDGAGGAPPA